MHYCATCNRLTDWVARCEVCRDKRIAKLEAEARCPVCLGKPRADDDPCAECYGKGFASTAYEHVRNINKRLEGRIAELEAGLREIVGSARHTLHGEEGETVLAREVRQADAYEDLLEAQIVELRAALREIAAKPKEVLAILEENNLVVTGKLELTIYTELVVAAEIANRALEGK